MGRTGGLYDTKDATLLFKRAGAVLGVTASTRLVIATLSLVSYCVSVRGACTYLPLISSVTGGYHGIRYWFLIPVVLLQNLVTWIVFTGLYPLRKQQGFKLKVYLSSLTAWLCVDLLQEVCRSTKIHEYLVAVVLAFAIFTPMMLLSALWDERWSMLKEQGVKVKGSALALRIASLSWTALATTGFVLVFHYPSMDHSTLACFVSALLYPVMLTAIGRIPHHTESYERIEETVYGSTP
eukprot:TRINITY_DN50702_c0_g1_i1.p1 TRINITY_DN50702_c0_g1~~TRINITY_DN50702_c0_g1_i1.p1  ORF type:complete len:238 (+),score=29.56 TRINITY_DN50702_c0_g1_i1:76-789(+)